MSMRQTSNLDHNTRDTIHVGLIIYGSAKEKYWHCASLSLYLQDTAPEGSGSKTSAHLRKGVSPLAQCVIYQSPASWWGSKHGSRRD